MHGTFDRTDAERHAARELDAVTIVTAAAATPRHRLDAALVAGLGLLLGLATILGMGFAGLG
jgi:hypothetical protein